MDICRAHLVLPDEMYLVICDHQLEIFPEHFLRPGLSESIRDPSHSRQSFRSKVNPNLDRSLGSIKQLCRADTKTSTNIPICLVLHPINQKALLAQFSWTFEQMVNPKSVGVKEFFYTNAGNWTRISHVQDKNIDRWAKIPKIILINTFLIPTKITLSWIS